VTPEPLTCKELVTDCFEEALSSEECRRIEAHLAPYPGGDTYLRQMRQTVELAGKLSEDSIDPGAQHVPLSAFRRWKEKRGPEGPDNL
jgi:hypothetical protein